MPDEIDFTFMWFRKRIAFFETDPEVVYDQFPQDLSQKDLSFFFFFLEKF